MDTAKAGSNLQIPLVSIASCVEKFTMSLPMLSLDPGFLPSNRYHDFVARKGRVVAVTTSILLYLEELSVDLGLP